MKSVFLHFFAVRAAMLLTGCAAWTVPVPDTPEEERTLIPKVERRPAADRPVVPGIDGGSLAVRWDRQQQPPDSCGKPAVVSWGIQGIVW